MPERLCVIPLNPRTCALLKDFLSRFSLFLRFSRPTTHEIGLCERQAA